MVEKASVATDGSREVSSGGVVRRIEREGERVRDGRRIGWRGEWLSKNCAA